MQLYPRVQSFGANGCKLQKPGYVIGIITIAELSFIVQEPSGIIPFARPQSLSHNFMMYLINSVSDCIELNIYYCIKSVFLAIAAGIPLKTISSNLARLRYEPFSIETSLVRAKISMMSAKSSIVVVSLMVIPTRFSLTFLRLMSFLWNSERRKSELEKPEALQSMTTVSK